MADELPRRGGSDLDLFHAAVRPVTWKQVLARPEFRSSSWFADMVRTAPYLPPIAMYTPTNQPPYPHLSLPDPIRDAVTEAFQIVQAPMPLVASAGLTAVSLASEGVADILRLDFLKSPCQLYFMSVAERNERKSKVDEIFLQSIRRSEAEHAQQHVFRLAEYLRRALAFKEKKRALTQLVREEMLENPDATEALDKLDAHLRTEPRRPRELKMLYTDMTPEGLLKGLHLKHRHAGLIAAEGGIVFNSRAMQNLGLLNDLWDGRDVPVDRASSESFTVRDARLTISVMVQPDIIRKYLSKKGPEFSGSGFRARALWSQPESTQGTRFIVNPNPSMEHLDRFGDRLWRILLESMPDDSGAYRPRKLLKLSYKAQQLWIKFHDEVEKNVGPFGLFIDVRDGAGKMADNAARMAGLFHIYLGLEGEVEEELMERAISICSWHLMEFKRLFGVKAEISQPGEDANNLEMWLRTNRYRFPIQNCGPRLFLLRHGPNQLRSKARLDPALDVLIAQNKLELVTAQNDAIWVRLNPYFFPAGTGIFIPN